LDKSRDFHDRGCFTENQRCFTENQRCSTENQRCFAKNHGCTIYGYGYDRFWHDDDGFNDILMFFADFNPELAKFIHQAAKPVVRVRPFLAPGCWRTDTHPNRPRGAGIPPAGWPGVPPGDRTGGETPPALAARDGCATWASVQKPERTMPRPRAGPRGCATPISRRRRPALLVNQPDKHSSINPVARAG